MQPRDNIISIEWSMPAMAPIESQLRKDQPDREGKRGKGDIDN